MPEVLVPHYIAGVTEAQVKKKKKTQQVAGAGAILEC
jgi:hypothetical protein